MFNQILSAGLALWLGLAGCFGFGNQTDCVRASQAKDCCPIVFVHGLGGWGEGAGINGVMPHPEFQNKKRPKAVCSKG